MDKQKPTTTNNPLVYRIADPELPTCMEVWAVNRAFPRPMPRPVTTLISLPQTDDEETIARRSIYKVLKSLHLVDTDEHAAILIEEMVLMVREEGVREGHLGIAYDMIDVLRDTAKIDRLIERLRRKGNGTVKVDDSGA